MDLPRYIQDDENSRHSGSMKRPEGRPVWSVQISFVTSPVRDEYPSLSSSVTGGTTLLHIRQAVVFIYSVVANMSDICVWREEFSVWLAYFVKMGMFTTVVCFCGIDDFEVDGRWCAFYNMDQILTEVAERVLSKCCDRFGVVCIVTYSCGWCCGGW